MSTLKQKNTPPSGLDPFSLVGMALIPDQINIEDIGLAIRKQERSTSGKSNGGDSNGGESNAETENWWKCKHCTGILETFFRNNDVAAKYNSEQEEREKE